MRAHFVGQVWLVSPLAAVRAGPQKSSGRPTPLAPVELSLWSLLAGRLAAQRARFHRLFGLSGRWLGIFWVPTRALQNAASCLSGAARHLLGAGAGFLLVLLLWASRAPLENLD